MSPHKNHTTKPKKRERTRFGSSPSKLALSLRKKHGAIADEDEHIDKRLLSHRKYDKKGDIGRHPERPIKQTPKFHFKTGVFRTADGRFDARITNLYDVKEVLNDQLDNINMVVRLFAVGKPETSSDPICVYDMDGKYLGIGVDDSVGYKVRPQLGLDLVAVEREHGVNIPNTVWVNVYAPPDEEKLRMDPYFSEKEAADNVEEYFSGFIGTFTYIM